MLSTPTTTPMGPLPLLMTWLAERAIEHEVHEHARTVTARAAANAEGVDPRTFAKVVGVKTDGDRTFLLIVDATDHVDLVKARQALFASDVHLLTPAAAAAPG